VTESKRIEVSLFPFTFTRTSKNADGRVGVAADGLGRVCVRTSVLACTVPEILSRCRGRNVAAVSLLQYCGN
jgi:hypothetical protein